MQWPSVRVAFCPVAFCGGLLTGGLISGWPLVLESVTRRHLVANRHTICQHSSSVLWYINAYSFSSILYTWPEALCFQVVRPSVCVCVRTCVSKFTADSYRPFLASECRIRKLKSCFIVCRDVEFVYFIKCVWKITGNLFLPRDAMHPLY